jgi:hypothetical protein
VNALFLAAASRGDSTIDKNFDLMQSARGSPAHGPCSRRTCSVTLPHYLEIM